MSIRGKPPARTFRRRLAGVCDAGVGWLTLAIIRAIRLTNRRRAAGFAGWLMRKLGPWLPEHRLGRANLVAAFPEKSPAEIEQILAGVWDNLGRVAAEFAHLDRMRFQRLAFLPDSFASSASQADEVVYDRDSEERARRMLAAGRGTLLFTAHLGNWELPALVGPALGIDTAVLFRRPNIRAVADAIISVRANSMGKLVPTGIGAPVELLHLLQANCHVGMLVDQHHEKGVEVTFFGRRCRANPLLARLARHAECPIHGVRIVRLPDGNRFRGEITEPIEPARDAEGRIDVQGTMQAITAIVEAWVREHPEQWLWLHRRWRPFPSEGR